jgi:VWFA-related protein
LTNSTVIALFLLATPLIAQDIVQPVDMSMKDLQAILIEADSGSLLLTVSDSPRLRGEVHYSFGQNMHQGDFAKLTSIEGSTLVINTSRPGAGDAPTQLKLEVPKGISVTVDGHSLSARAEGFVSPLNIRSVSGNAEIVNPIGPTAVYVISGNITATLNAQPREDLYLHADSGLIRCSLDDGLSLKSLLRSGSQISWGAGVETFQGSLERSLGSGGPLLFASSRLNQVRVDLTPSKLPSTNAQSMVVLHLNADWVYMNTVVRDQTDQTITNLRRESFDVFDNGLPVELRHFESTSEPFHLLLLFDVSASIKPHLALIREAAKRFIQQANNGDEVAIATFSSTSELVQPFTADHDAADRALNAITPAGGTAIYDAVYRSIVDYMKGASGRKAIILFTDGIDNSLWGQDFGSTHSFNELLRTVKGSDCLIYPIFVRPVPDRRTQVKPQPNASPTSIVELLANATGKNPKILCGSETDPNIAPAPCPVDPYQVIAAGENHLRQLADQTGGRMYSPRRIEDLADSYSQVASDLKSSYTLGFPIQIEDFNQWHELKIRVRDMPLAVIRTRRGYYSPGKSQ